MNYKSPSMKIPQIVTAMKEIGFNLTEDDFRKPQPRRWREFYAKIFENLTDVSMEVAIHRIHQMSIIKIPHPELFEEGFSQMAFTLCMRRVLCSCGFDRFSVKDMIEPTAKNLVRIGSVFVNTCRHNSTRKIYFAELIEEIEWSRGEFDKISNKNKELKEQLSKLKELNQEKEAEIVQCNEELVRLKAQLEEFQKEPIVREIDEIKCAMAEKNALKEKLKRGLLDVQQECEKLSNKIVSSPERFKQDQDRLRNKMQQLKAQLDAKGKKLLQDRALLELAVNKRSASEKLVKLVKEIQTDVKMAREGTEEMERLSEKARELQEQRLSLMTQKEDLEENIAIRQGQKQKILSKSGLNKQCGEQELSDLVEHCQILERQLDSVHAEINSIAKTKSEGKENFRLENQGYEKRKAEIEAEFPSYYEEGKRSLHPKISTTDLATSGVDKGVDSQETTSTD